MRHESYANCASGTAHNDGEKILEAIRQQQRERLQQARKPRCVPLTEHLKQWERNS